MSGTVSFIMPSIRMGEECQFAIESILTQSWKRVELICIIPKMAQTHPIFEYKDPRVKVVYELDCDNPFTAAMNQGIEAATGDLITFAQDDDIQIREKAEVLYHYIYNREQIDGAFSGWAIFGSDLKIRGLRLGPRKLGLDNFKRAGSYSASGFAVRKDRLGEIRFDESYRYIFEFLFLLDCAMKLTIEDIRMPMFCQKIHSSFSRDDTVECKVRELDEYARLRKERNDPHIGDLKERAWRKHLFLGEAA